MTDGDDAEPAATDADATEPGHAGEDLDTDGDAETDGGEGTDGSRSSSEPSSDGGVRAYTVRLELVDEPGELLRALEPIAQNGGNLLSIHHERGNITPRGHIPVQVDIECPPDRFDGIVDALREAGVNVIQAGAERYGEELTVILVGHLVDTDLSGTLSAIQTGSHAAVVDLSLAAPDGTDAVSSARLRLSVDTGRVADVLESVREVAAAKDLGVIEPLPGGEA